MKKTSERLSEKQINTLIQGLKDDLNTRDMIYVMLSYYLGLRISDCLNLKWEDVISDTGMIKSEISIIETKTKKERELRMNSKLSTALLKFYHSKGNPTGYIISKKNGGQLTPRNFNYKIKEWGIDYLKCEVKHLSSHSFRKTFGYNVWLKMNKSMEALLYLQKAFGHSTIEMTKKYLGITKDEKLSVYNML